MSDRLAVLPLLDIESCDGGARRSGLVLVDDDGSCPSEASASPAVDFLSVAYLFCISLTFSSVVIAVQSPKSLSLMWPFLSRRILSGLMSLQRRGVEWVRDRSR